MEQALREDNLERVRELNERDPLAILAKDENGVPIALQAAVTASLPVIRYLAEYTRVNMSLRDENLRGFLHYAAGNPKREIAEYLVEKIGMDPLAGDRERLTPYELAVQEKNQAVAAWFEEKVGASLSDLYKNPIRTGAFPDPSVVRVGEDYYMVNSSFTYFPCIPISHSRDLVHWEIIGHAITDPEDSMLEGLESGRGYWAPDISYAPNEVGEGTFYVTATYRLNDEGTVYRRQVVVSSQRPEGPYGKPVIIDEDGIDPSLFHDEDGRHYMLLNRGARLLELDQTLSHVISPARMLWYGDCKIASEGPHLLKKDGWYYLFLAEGGTGMGHRVSVARARTLEGPFEGCPWNPILRQMDPEAAIQRCGHGKPVQTPVGDWYLPYLCGRRLEGRYTVLGRETALDPMEWTSDGWPIVNRGRGPSCLQKRPAGMHAGSSSTLPWEGFWQRKQDGTLVLDPVWMWSKLPTKDAASPLAEGGLCLRGSKLPLENRDAKNILVRRQTEFRFSFAMHLQAELPEEGQEAGILCYYDENTWLSFGLVNTQRGPVLRVTEQCGREHRIPIEEAWNEAESLRVSLRIDTDGLKRSFFWRTERDWQEFGSLERVDYLCDEGCSFGKRFTGAMYGIYAYAGEEAAAYGSFWTGESPSPLSAL